MSDSDEEMQQGEIENGHIGQIAGFRNRNALSSSSSEEEEELIGEFNTDLPTSHRYLGRLNDLGGYTLFDDNEILSLLGIYTNTLVLPGFTLPLVFDDPQEGSVMEHFLNKDKVFVLLSTHFSKPSEFFEYGVTMEAVETSMKEGVLSLKARGRQRCLLLSEIKYLSEKFRTVMVKILPEYKVTSPLIDTQLYTLKNKRPYTCEDYADMKKIRKYRKYHVAQFTYPYWLYEEYEVCYFVKQILDGLRKCFVMDFIPKDPVLLSYWFIQNYLLQYEERLRLLQENTVLSRLRLELKYLKDNKLMMCHNCRQKIAEQKDIIVLSKDGAQNNFVNPGGHNYEILTVSQTTNFILLGRPTRKFSWFPGYAWSIMQCKQCKLHIGWKFTSNTLAPEVFYGLAWSCIIIANDLSKSSA